MFDSLTPIIHDSVGFVLSVGVLALGVWACKIGFLLWSRPYLWEHDDQPKGKLIWNDNIPGTAATRKGRLIAKRIEKAL